MGIAIVHIKTKHGGQVDEVDLAEKISLYLNMHNIDADVIAEEKR